MSPRTHRVETTRPIFNMYNEPVQGAHCRCECGETWTEGTVGALLPTRPGVCDKDLRNR